MTGVCLMLHFHCRRLVLAFSVWLTLDKNLWTGRKLLKFCFSCIYIYYYFLYEVEFSSSLAFLFLVLQVLCIRSPFIFLEKLFTVFILNWRFFVLCNWFSKIANKSLSKLHSSSNWVETSRTHGSLEMFFSV